MPTVGASIIVDNSKLGHDALVQIVERCSATGREVLGLHMLQGVVEEQSLLDLNIPKSSLLLADIGKMEGQELLNMIENMGLLGFNEGVRMFVTKRAIENIKTVEGYESKLYLHYAAINTTLPSISYITDKVRHCRKMGVIIEQVECRKRFA